MPNELVEVMVGHRTRLAQENRKNWHTREDQSLHNYLQQSKKLDRLGIIMQAVLGRGWLLIGLGGIAFDLIQNSVSGGKIALSLGGIILASQSLNTVIYAVVGFTGALISWQQVGPLFNAARRGQKQDTGPKIMPFDLEWPARKDQVLININKLKFRFRASGPAVIDQCSLSIKPCDRLLLEGPSGSGKSTLSALIANLRQPQSGRISLWGLEQREMAADIWRQRIATAPQFHENHLLTATLAFNLLMGRTWPPSAQDLEDAATICQELGLGDLLAKMPAGFQQMVGEGGWRLSHGERSRVYIARALLQKSDLIILDESLAALDSENLQLVLQCVLKRAPALMLIAHP